MSLEDACNTAKNKASGIASKYIKKFPEQEVIKVFEFSIGISDDIKTQINELTTFMDSLESAMDGRMGIRRVEVQDKLQHINGNAARVIIRDARGQSKMKEILSPQDLPETFQMIAAGRARGALYLIQQCSGQDQDQVQSEVMKHLVEFDEKIKSAKTQKQRRAFIKSLDKRVLKSLKNSGLSLGNIPLGKMRAKLQNIYADARDVANLTEQDHPSIISISDFILTEGMKSCKVISQIPVRPFQDPDSKIQDQDWYKKMQSSNEAINTARIALIDGVKDKLNDGKHQKPTQLGFVGGVPNLSLQEGHFVDAKGDEVGGDDTKYQLFRSGTAVHNRGKGGDKELVQTETQKNVDYLYSLSGSQNINSLNHESGIKSALRSFADKFTFRPISAASLRSGIVRGKYIQEFVQKFVSSDKGVTHALQCKSGKDRTGLVVIETDLQTTQNFCREKNLAPEEILKEEKKVMDCCVAELNAGGRGGTRGVMGLKIAGTFASKSPKLRLSGGLACLKFKSRLLEGNSLSKLNNVKLGFKIIDGAKKWVQKIRKSRSAASKSQSVV